MYADNYVYLIIGQKKCGKTTLMHKVITASPRKGVIYQSLRDTTFNNFPRLTESDFKSRSNEGKKRTSEAYIDYEDMIDFCTEKVDGSEILIDDFTGYESSTLSKKCKKLISRNRHSFNNIYFAGHSLMEMPKKMWHNADYLILFKTADTLEELQKHKSRFPQFAQIYKAAEAVKKNKNPHARVKVEL